MFRKLKQFFGLLGFKPTPDTSVLKPPIPNEDQRDYQKRKRVADLFEQEKEFILARSMRPHSIDCKDPLTCENMKCWSFIPDKIASEPYKVVIRKGNK